MCDLVVVGDEICETQAELKAALRATDLIANYSLGYDASAMRDDLCLCPVDIFATAKSLGMYAEPLAGDESFWRIVPERARRF